MPAIKQKTGRAHGHALSAKRQAAHQSEVETASALALLAEALEALHDQVEELRGELKRAHQSRPHAAPQGTPPPLPEYGLKERAPLAAPAEPIRVGPPYPDAA